MRRLLQDADGGLGELDLRQTSTHHWNDPRAPNVGMWTCYESAGADKGAVLLFELSPFARTELPWSQSSPSTI
ncbi:hypothetical protein ACVIM8_001758 [Bradyrhizobium sp. USDA 4529]